MKSRKIFFVLSLIITTVCLAGGFLLAGQWIGSVLIILSFVVWILTNRSSSFSSLPHLCLALSVIFAVMGIYFGAPALLMIIGATAALATWDLVLFNRSMNKQLSVDKHNIIEKLHFQSLLAACVIGCSIAAVNTLFTLQIPFVLMFFMVAAFLFCFDRLLHYLKNSKKS